MTLRQATHGGVLVIGELTLTCYVLEDRTRVLGQDALLKAFGQMPRAKCRDDDHPLPAFLADKNLQPFIDEQLRLDSRPVKFRTEEGDRTFGYRAQMLPGVCNVYLEVRDAGKLRKTQQALAHLSCRLVRKLAIHGVIARIDSALKYRALRHHPSMDALLERYMNPFAGRWSKRFPDEFYEEIYRLKGWEWLGMGVNRVPIIGHITNEIIYARITDGLLDRLRIKNPKDAEGEREHKHHQWLTDDFGVQELREHIVGVMAIMRSVVDTDPERAWQKFCIRLERAYPRKDTDYPLKFDEED